MICLSKGILGDINCVQQVDIGVRRLNEYETIFLKKNSVMAGTVVFTDEWLELKQESIDAATC